MQKASPRGILSPDRIVLSPRQRQEYLRLKANGVPDAVARQLAFAFDKSARRDSDQLVTELLEDALQQVCLRDAKKAASHYERNFINAAQESMAADAYAAVHARARGQAGGRASADARAQAASPDEALKALWARRNALTAELADLDGRIAALPVRKDTFEGITHVDVPMPPARKRGKKRRKVSKDERPKDIFADRNRTFLPLLDHDERPINQRMMDAARLVSGMDYESRLGAAGPEDARARASRSLTQDRGKYDRIFMQDPDLKTVPGYDVDLGSGQARQAGYLGLDLFPYDYGTALHDVSLGLPFGDSELRSVRLVNALEYMPDFAEDATPLLSEIQRCLNYGGKLFYEGIGDLEDYADFSQLPGLVLVEHEDTKPLAGQEPSETTLTKQVFERVRVRIPQMYGANPEWLGVDENSPVDLQIALDALGLDAPADYVMADLIGKAEGVTPPKGVQAACQRGLELAPEYGGKGLTDGAKARARNMADGKAVSPANIRKMSAWFARHASYAKTSSPPSPGYVAWLLWGGDAGKKWAETQVGRMEKKGRAPLGAAFSHARASGKKKDKESVRRRANAYLRSKGHPPMGTGKTEKRELRVEGGTLVAKGTKNARKWQQLVTSVIYSPHELDTDGEYIEAKCLEKLAHQAMLDRVPVKLEHDGEPVGAALVESYIAPVSFTVDGPAGPQQVRKGAWVGTFQINDPQIWQDILDGKLRGVSVGGVAAGEYR